MSAKMLEAESFKCTSTYRLPSWVNELYNSSNMEINEVSHGMYNNYCKSGGYKGNYQNKDQKKWHNKDETSWNKDKSDNKPWQKKVKNVMG